MCIRDSPTTVVPLVIEGTFEAMPTGRRWPRPHRVRVRFGAAIPPEELRPEDDEDNKGAAIAARLHDRVAALQAEGEGRGRSR